jgi:hypothetical protein
MGMKETFGWMKRSELIGMKGRLERQLKDLGEKIALLNKLGRAGQISRSGSPAGIGEYRWFNSTEVEHFDDVCIKLDNDRVNLREAIRELDVMINAK